MTDTNEKPNAQGKVIDIAEWTTVPESAIAEDLLATRMRQAGIPRMYARKSLNAFQTDLKPREAVLKAAREYVDYFVMNKGQHIDGAMIEGVVGSGKTHVAIGILMEIIAKGFSGLYCNVPEFFKEVRRTYGMNTGPDESQLIDETRDPDILVLDDLGVEGRVLDPVRDNSKWLCERLYLIVNGRYETDKPVIVTTNCDRDSLTRQLDKRIVSRLVEMTRRRFPDFPNRDFRLQHLK